MEPVAVPDATAQAALPKPLHACPACGFLGIRPVGMREGFVPAAGEMAGLYQCPRCGYQGPSAEFPAGADYAVFVRSLHAR